MLVRSIFPEEIYRKISSAVFICENREGGWDGYFHRSKLDTEEWECESKEQGEVG